MSRALDLLRRLRPPLESRLEVALEASRAVCQGSWAARAPSDACRARGLERRHHLGNCASSSATRASAPRARAAPGAALSLDRSSEMGRPVGARAPPQRLLLGGAHRGRMRSLGTHFFPLRETAANSVMRRSCKIQIRVVSARSNARSWLTRITVPSYSSTASSSASIDSTSR